MTGRTVASGPVGTLGPAEEDVMTKADESLCERHREFVPLIAAIDRVSGELEQGSDAATKEMLSEHREISRLTDELEQIRLELAKAGIGAQQEAEMRRVLDGLKRAIETHFEQEEQACFQVLKTELSPQEAEELYASLEQATAAIRRTYGCGGGRGFN